MAATISSTKQDGAASAGRRLARRAWVCVGLTPAAWVLAIVAEYVVGGGGEPGYAWYTQIPFWVLFVSAPAVAFALAILARRMDRGAGKVALVVSAALLTFSVWAMVAGSANFSIGLATVVAMVVVTLLVIYVWPGLRESPPE